MYKTKQLKKESCLRVSRHTRWNQRSREHCGYYANARQSETSHNKVWHPRIWKIHLKTAYDVWRILVALSSLSTSKLNLSRTQFSSKRSEGFIEERQSLHLNYAFIMCSMWCFFLTHKIHRRIGSSSSYSVAPKIKKQRRFDFGRKKSCKG